jgi:hypothetical protein
VEVARAPERPLLDQHHLQAGGGQYLRRDATAGARAHDRDVRFEREVAVECGGIGDLPAGREPLADRIADHPTSGGPG